MSTPEKANLGIQPIQTSPAAAWEIAFEKLAQIQANFIDETRSSQANQEASIRNLEIQICQLSRQLSERAPGQFPSDTITNPKEHCKEITTRSGIVITPQEKSKVVQEKVDTEVNNKKTQEKEETKEQPSDTPKKQMDFSRFNKPPYPVMSKQQAQRQQYAKFLDIFKKLQINIPFAEALQQMPSYAKFLKEILSKKRKLTTEGSTILTEECSAIMKKNLPPKLKDPGSFSIPCTIGKTTIDGVLCDLGASVNVMPLSLMKKLEITEVKSTRMNVQLADRSTRQAYGIVEDALVKVDKFLIPVDFVILDIDEDASVPMIFGRPFLATAGALIDVPKGEMMLRVDGEQATFKVLKKEAPLPASQSQEQIFYLAEKKVEVLEKEAEEKKKKDHEPDKSSKPKVKKEKSKNKGKYMKTKFRVLETAPNRPYAREYYYGKAKFMEKGMAALLKSNYKPP